MSTADAVGADVVIVGPAALPLVRAGAALRWNRPDLTATLAELALESATDVDTWVVSAGWLLHGRAALGDGRDTACDLLDGLDRWGDAGVERMAGPAGRRLRVELAAPARRVGEPTVARALLAGETGVGDDDPELQADVLTELARCAVDDAPESADDALRAAEQAWRAVACAPGVAAVTLLRAARSRRSGSAEVASTEAAAGLDTLNAGGRRAGATRSDHVAAALTAERIAALVEAGRIDEARDDALPAAQRLIAAARPSRQVAGLRLAIARLTAVAEGRDVVLAALEPAAQDAADSNVPELESACRSMLGELHEGAGRLDAALAALRAAMAAERRDRERSARLRGRLATVTDSWAGRPSRAAARTTTPPSRDLSAHELPAHDLVRRAVPADEWSSDEVRPRGAGASDPRPSAPGPALAGPTRRSHDGTGRRARRRVAESLDALTVGIVEETARHDAASATGRRARRDEDEAGDGRGDGAELSATDRTASSGNRVAASGYRAADSDSLLGGSFFGGSLIGDALFRELGGIDGRDGGHDGDRPGVAADAPLVDTLGTGGFSRSEQHRSSTDGPALPGEGARHDAVRGDTGVDASTVRWDRAAWIDRPASIADTVVFGIPVDRSDTADDRDATGGRDGVPGAAHRRRRSEPDDASPVAGPTGGAAAAAHPADPSPAPHGDPVSGSPLTGSPNGAHRIGPHAGDDVMNGGGRRRAYDGVHDSAPDGHAPNGHAPNGHAPEGSGPDGHASETGAPSDHDAPEIGTSNDSGPPRRSAAGRGAGRPPSTDADGLGLADLLAGALAAYRDL